MNKLLRHGSIPWFLFALSLVAPTSAQDAVLFNGKDLEGWSVRLKKDHPELKEDPPWIVHQGLLVCTGNSTGYLLHTSDFENYVLTLDWRSMQLNGNGVAVSGLGSVFIHTTDEQGAFSAPKSIEVSLDDVGAVYFRDVDSSADSKS